MGGPVAAANSAAFHPDDRPWSNRPPTALTGQVLDRLAFDGPPLVRLQALALDLRIGQELLDLIGWDSVGGHSREAYGRGPGDLKR